MVADFRKKQKYYSKNRLLLLCGGAVVVLVCALLIIADMGIYSQRKALALQIKNLETKVQDLTDKNASIKEQIAKSNDQQYIEKVAREELDLQKSGEKVVSFIVPPSQASSSVGEKKNAFEAWLGWLSALFNKK